MDDRPAGVAVVCVSLTDSFATEAMDDGEVDATEDE